MSGESSGIKSKYFVAFRYRKANGSHGEACTVIERESPVSDWDDILNMMDCIISRNPAMKEIVIANWRKMEDPE